MNELDDEAEPTPSVMQFVLLFSAVIGALLLAAIRFGCSLFTG
jgi:hypothetical protein